MPEFKGFPKIPRLYRDVTITEKIDGTNACVVVTEYGDVYAQSRKRIITPGKSTDNHGFAAWVEENATELFGYLGPGHHFGEWYGKGINRGYGLDERRFALFNAAKWGPKCAVPPCCEVVPVLAHGTFSQVDINRALSVLKYVGSAAVPGYMNPEGIIVFHHAGNHLFKVLIENDDQPKSAVA